MIGQGHRHGILSSSYGFLLMRIGRPRCDASDSVLGFRGWWQNELMLGQGIDFLRKTYKLIANDALPTLVYGSRLTGIL